MVEHRTNSLILVRHSLPTIDPTVPASQWQLSDEGRRRCKALAAQLAAYAPDRVVTSIEPKAAETGQIVARILNLPFETAPDLHEHERPAAGVFGTRAQFQAQVGRLFAQPGELILGRETADQAHRRFAGAVANVVAQHPGANLAIVAHGTVMTLLVARAAGFDPFPFWQRLGLPAVIVLSLPDLALLQVVENCVPILDQDAD